jgi:hypothetical protein
MKNAAKFGFSGLILVGALAMQGCEKIEPEEIDFLDGGDTGAGEDDGDGDGDGDLTTTGMDTSTGDGDPGGDGDGDGDGDESTGDGDGETGDGDADIPCAGLEAEPLLEGVNDIAVPNVMSSFDASCGAPGPDVLLSFTAPSDAIYRFSLSSPDFEGVIYLAGPTCDPLEELDCQPEGEDIAYPMFMDEVVYVVVDSFVDPGAATVTITAI